MDVREPVLPAYVPQPLDQELLAWAAGFFDGEGTTFAHADKRRLNYRQLDVSVPQAGRGGVPEVLLKFQRAMLGMGMIYLDRHGLYKWRAGGRVGAELSLALMWPFLRTVKRAQALDAMDRVEHQYATGVRSRRKPRYRPTFVAHALGVESQGHPRIDRAWAAGFLDAEGCFGVTALPRRKDGTAGVRIRVSASQHGAPGVPADVLLYLRKALAIGRIERHGDADDFKWTTGGERNVRTVLEAVRPWLSEVKTHQALQALATHVTFRVRGNADTCIRGHTYDGLTVRPDGAIHHHCSACDQIRRDAARTRSMLGEAVIGYAA